jgi:1-acyl-sn-glycerol-3-phosphate acyltransferase
MTAGQTRLLLRLGGAVRRLFALGAWGLLVAVWCRRLRISGLENVPDRPVLIVANHSSHADTVLLQFALAIGHRHPVLVAGADDYWFATRTRAVVASAVGVFAFPRQGERGVQRARKALRRRATVIMFPQGSRAGGRFRAGVGRIAAEGSVEVVPVHIAGADSILPRGSGWPSRGDVVITIGRPTCIGRGDTPAEFADRLERLVIDELARAS